MHVKFTHNDEKVAFSQMYFMSDFSVLRLRPGK